MTRPLLRPLSGVAAALSGLALAGLAAVAPAAAQPAAPEPRGVEAPIPPALRGAWFAGECAAPTAMLALAARGAARIPAEGTGRLLRFTEARAATAGGGTPWILGTARGNEAPRLMLRAAGSGVEGIGLETAEPDNKTRDDRLPGAAPTLGWRRCPATPLAFAAHAEGVAFLGALETLEAACGPAPGAEAGSGAGTGGTVPDCAAALIRVGDVSGDRLLGTAEIARLLRGAGWTLSLQAEVAPDLSGLVGAAGAVGGLAAARLLVESLDYDGDGRLSARELLQDRAALATAGEAAGRPLALEHLSEGVALLRGLVEGLLASE